jgi:predicted nucleotidyltransferase
MAKPVVDQAALSRICTRFGIRKLSLFGSVLKGTDNEESDVDLIVEFEREAAPGLIGLAALEQELPEIFGGRRVDLRTPNDLSPYFRREVLEWAEVQYVA